MSGAVHIDVDAVLGLDVPISAEGTVEVTPGHLTEATITFEPLPPIDLGPRSD